MEKHLDETPQTETSTSLRGGTPPIPPYNKPPVLTAIGTPDPEDDDIRNVIECTSEEEARNVLRGAGYDIMKISARYPSQRKMIDEGNTTLWERTRETLSALYWSVREQITELMEVLEEGHRVASTPRQSKKVV